ncbi:MAG TPA: hypothetical protein DD670_02080 [Planctomycetaceae bacterium]|nr:hypothetical protein [Planctomycetaceae bacterium]
MPRSAKLISIDAVRDMAAALTRFGDEAVAAIDELDINVRRALEWIDHDRKNFWSHEVRRGWERVGEARAELEKAQTYRKMADETPSCRQERATLEKAKQRVQTAEEKDRSLPRWAHAVEHAVRELTGAETQLVDWVHGELPRALSVLRQYSAALERYAAVGEVASDKPKPAAGGAGEALAEELPTETTETEEPDNEDLGSVQPGGEASPGIEGSASSPG